MTKGESACQKAGFDLFREVINRSSPAPATPLAQRYVAAGTEEALGK